MEGMSVKWAQHMLFWLLPLNSAAGEVSVAVGLLKSWGFSLSCWSSGSVGTPLFAIGVRFGWCCVGLGFGLSDHFGSLLNQDIL